MDGKDKRLYMDGKDKRRALRHRVPDRGNMGCLRPA